LDLVMWDRRLQLVTNPAALGDRLATAPWMQSSATVAYICIGPTLAN
jgi:hypothetical protein